MRFLVKYFVTILMMFLGYFGKAQPDTIPAPQPRPVDSATLARAQAAKYRLDSIRNQLVQDSLQTLRRQDSLRMAALQAFMQRVDSSRYSGHPYMRFSNPQRRIAAIRVWDGKEGLFYALVGVVLFFALLRNAFARYLADLFRTFFRTSIRQRLIKEQVANAPLPSLLFNTLFMLAGALLASLLLIRFGLGTGFPFWLLFLYCLAGLVLIYVTKFLVLKLFGWLLHASDATNTYIFVVFATNKVLGILVLPVLFGLAFTQGATYEVFFALTLAMIGGLFLYRFYLSFVSVHKLISINVFHFLLYLAAFEVAPLLLINKLLVQFFAQTP